MQLSGDQLDAFHQALRSAFPTRPALAQFVRFGLETPLETIGEGPSLSQTIFHVLQWAEAQGKLDALLRAALAAHPTNPSLAAFAAQVAPALVPPAPTAPVGPSTAALTARIAALEADLRARDAEIAQLRAQLTAAPSAGMVPLAGRQVPVSLLVSCLHFVRRVAQGSSSMQGTPRGPYENQRVFARRVQQEAVALLQELGDRPPDA